MKNQKWGRKVVRPERLKATAQRAGSKVSLIIAKVLSPALRLEHEKYYKDSAMHKISARPQVSSRR